jgi:hypothetical protein
MPDWVKVLIGAVSGFVFAGVNPLVADWVKRRQLHRALYIELSANIGVLAAYGFLDSGRVEYEQAREIFGPLLQHEAFDHALKQPDVFLRMKDAGTIRFVYGWMASLDDEVHGRTLGSLLHDLAGLMDDGTLNVRLIRKLVPVHLRENVVKLPEESRAWRRAQARSKRDLIVREAGKQAGKR